MVAPVDCRMEPELTLKVSSPSSGKLLHSFSSSSSSSSLTIPKSYPTENKTTTRCKRSVHFASCVDVYIIESRHQFSKEEIENSYLSREEMDNIRTNVRECLQKLLLVDVNPEDDGSDNIIDDELRGLEVYAPNLYLARSQRMRLAVRTLLKQQEFGRIDDRWLRKSYSALTEASIASAQLRGIKDRQADPSSPPFSQIMVR